MYTVKKDEEGMADFFRNIDLMEELPKDKKDYSCMHAEYCGNSGKKYECNGSGCGTECEIHQFLYHKNKIKKDDLPPSY